MNYRRVLIVRWFRHRVFSRTDRLYRMLQEATLWGAVARPWRLARPDGDIPVERRCELASTAYSRVGFAAGTGDIRWGPAFDVLLLQKSKEGVNRMAGPAGSML